MSKIISQFHLPKSWKTPYTAFYQEKLLLIAGYDQHFTHLLIYSRNGTAFKPFKYFKFTGTLGTFVIIQDKLVFMTREAITQQALNELIQKHGEAPNSFPQVFAGLKYGLDSLQALFPASCQKINHQLIPGIPHYWTTLAIFPLNALDKSPEINYYLGNFDHLSFGRDYFYLLQDIGSTQALDCKNCTFQSTGSEQRSLIQRFAFDPKIHQQYSAMLSGSPLDGKSMLSDGNRLKVATILSSGKLKQYQIFELDERFSLLSEHMVMRDARIWSLSKILSPFIFL